MNKPSQTMQWSRLKPNCYGRRQQQTKKIGRNRRIRKAQFGFSLDQYKIVTIVTTFPPQDIFSLITVLTTLSPP